MYLGIRFGTAELYAVLDHFLEVEDYIAVGQRRITDQDEQVLLFIKMRSGTLSTDLRQRICSAIRQALSPRHVPAEVLQVRDIPYTVNGKRIENLVRDIVCGRNPKASGTAANPECLKEYAQFFNLGQRKATARL